VRFALFPQAEYINMATMSAVATDLYLGGWHGLLPVHTPLDPLIEQYGLGWLVFLAKIGGFLFFYIWMRWTLPRYRYDQLMGFGWKFLLPVSVLNLLVSAAGWLYFNG
jgi:NADH-quinone oxidoreductase subunit H